MLTAPRFKNFIPFIKTEIAYVLFRQDKMEQSIDLYSEVVKARTLSEGTALASFHLAQIYEKNRQNIDSAVHYYGEVRKIFPKFDSVEVADKKYFFLSEMKKIRDDIKHDKFLIYKLENDSYFRDSLLTAQYEDSILKSLGNLPISQIDTSSLNIDTTSTLYKQSLAQLDSIKLFFSDSLTRVQNDTLRESLQDTIRIINNYIYFRAPKQSEIDLEKRKLPDIREDLKDNEYHLAEFFLLQVGDYDSSRMYYNKFLQHHSDSVLTPKAIYSLYFISSQTGYQDPVVQDSLEKVLINKYPDSPFAREILIKKGFLHEEVATDSLQEKAHLLFREAERYYDDKQIDQALDIFRRVAAMDTSLIWAAKAQLNIAWIYENEKRDTILAINEYTRLKENFIHPEFVSLASRKIAPVESHAPVSHPSHISSDSTLITEIPADSATAIPLSVQPGVPLPAEEGVPELPSVSNTKEYRDWRQNRILNN